MKISNIMTKGETSILFINRKKGFKKIEVLTRDIERIIHLKMRIINQILERADIEKLERKYKYILEVNAITKKRKEREIT